MPEVEETDAIIMGFVRWTFKQGKRLDVYSYEEIEGMIDDYMRSRMAGG